MYLYIFQWYILLLFSLFHVLGGSGVSKHILIAVEAIPSCDSGGGLGVKLSDALDGSSGCIVKSVAESSSVNGVLLSGDRSDHVYVQLV